MHCEGSAQIVSFGENWRARFQTSLLLDCFSVGFPHISTYWRHNGVQINPGYTCYSRQTLFIL